MAWWLAAVVLAEIYGTSPATTPLSRQECRFPGALNHYFPARTFDYEIQTSEQRTAFWTLPGQVLELAYDAHHWIIEIRQGARHHAVTRLVPPKEADLHALAAAMLKLGGFSEAYVE